MKKLYLNFALLACLPLWSQQVQVTFIVDLQLETVHDSGVHVAGDFPPPFEMHKMTNIGNALYAVTIPIDTGQTYSYAFFNGNTVGEIEAISPPCNTGQFGYRSFTSVTSGSQTVGPFCFSSCSPCPAVAANATFRVDMSEQTVSPNKVHIAASFNSFSLGQDEMTHQGSGIYTYTHSGFVNDIIGYRFVNGNSISDFETVPGGCAVGGNRGLIIPPGGVNTDVVCFSSCDTCVGGPPPEGIPAPVPRRLFSVHPTVTTDQIVISFEVDASDAGYRITDMTGRVVAGAEVPARRGSEEIINLDGLESGMYMVSVSAGQQVVTSKIILIR